MSSQPLAVQAAPVPSKREQLLALTRSGLRLFVSMVPSLLGAGLLGAIKGERMEGFLMEHSRRVLGLLALRAALTAPDASSAVRNVEDVGIERLELALADTLEDLFFIQMLLALTAGVLVAAAPAVIRLLLQ